MKTYIHIGFVKTGSTFLQKSLFPHFSSLKGRLYLGATKNIHQYNLLSKSYEYILISNENIAGHPLNYSSSVSWYAQFVNSINNLKSLYTKPYIILGVREPSAMIQSIYKQSLKEWSTKSWEQYLDLANQEYLNQFYFSKYVKLLLDKFPKERLFIYDHQELLDDAEGTLKRLGVFLDILEGNLAFEKSTNRKENVSVSLQKENLLLMLNRLSSGMHKVLGFRLAFRVGAFKLNPVILSDKVPIVFKKPKTKRDLTNFKVMFKDDWRTTKELINTLK